MEKRAQDLVVRAISRSNGFSCSVQHINQWPLLPRLYLVPFCAVRSCGHSEDLSSRTVIRQLPKRPFSHADRKNPPFRMIPAARSPLRRLHFLAACGGCRPVGWAVRLVPFGRSRTRKNARLVEKEDRCHFDRLGIDQAADRNDPISWFPFFSLRSPTHRCAIALVFT
jgi:hypothetical protein